METNNKLREALLKARSAICHFARHQCKSLSWEKSNIQANCGDVLCSWRDLCEAKTAINAALAEPARQCEVGTVAEQSIRFDDYCHSRKNSENRCRNCALNETLNFCALEWAQMPYEEGSAK